MPNLEIQYFFDPLCGWCYASAPALKGLSEEYAGQLRMMPVGMFFNARPISSIADHAWRNDQRISKLTGQQFTETYHRNVLLAPNGVFTSAPLTLALTALGEMDPGLEPRFLHAAQIARYIEGHDTSRIDEVVRVAEAVARENGVAFDAAAFAERLANDNALKRRVEQRIADAQRAMQALPGRGVPQVLVRSGNKTRTIDGEILYAGKDALLAAVREVRAAA